VNAGGEPPRGVAAMSALRWLLVGLMGAVALASVLYATGVFTRGGRSGSGAASAGQPSPTLYTCPMHPQIVRDRPGECPICAMALVPKQAAAPGGGPGAASPSDGGVAGLAPVDLTPERIQLSGIKTASAKREPLRSDVRAAGVISPSERGLAQINVRFAGWIQKLRVAETGRQVRKGDVLATIYSPDVLRAQQELITARGWSQTSPGGEPHALPVGNLAEDARRRLELLGLADAEIAEIGRTGQPLRDVPVRSTAAGTVIRKDAVEGAYVQPGSSLYTVADLSTVWVVAEVSESEIRRVRVGQAARLELPAYPGQTFTGKVSFVYPTLDSQTRTLRVRIELRNPKQLLRPGMYGTILLALPASEGLVVPSEAVVDTGEVQYVFVAKAGGRFDPRRVKLGARAEGRAPILDGLREGEVVVTTANFLIDSESRLRAAVAGQPAGAAP
jgi:membrane fusion protein, copper/silver efflux system